MAIRDVIYDTWEGFKQDFISDIYQNQEPSLGSWLFRGQSSDTWKLVSNFDRKYTNLSNRREFEKALLKTFQNLLRKTDIAHNFDNISETDTWALGQHYGLPTRLLDWSYSPYVAAFFSFADPAPFDDTYVSIYALNHNHEVWNGSFGCEIVENCIPVNENQIKQEGVFTLLKSTFNTLEDFVNSYSGCDTSEALIRMLIPKIERQKVIKDLKLMRITFETIFSGFESIAKTAEIETQMQYEIV